MATFFVSICLECSIKEQPAAPAITVRPTYIRPFASLVVPALLPDRPTPHSRSCPTRNERSFSPGTVLVFAGADGNVLR